MKRILFTVLVSLMLCAFVFLGNQTYAQEQQFPFTVVPVKPSNQISRDGYFHIPVKPGTQVTLKANVTNRSNKTLDFTPYALNAYSSFQGIFYSTPNEKSLIKYSITDKRYEFIQYLHPLSKFSLNAGESKLVPFTVDIPKGLDGTLLGSIRFQIFVGTANMTSGKSLLSIDQYQAVDTGIQLDYDKKPTLNKPIHVDNASFDPETLSATFDMTNTSSAILEGIEGDYDVHTESNEILFTGKIEPFKMSPHSKLTYSAYWNNQSLKKGDYGINIRLKGYEPIKSKLSVTGANLDRITEKQERLKPTVEQTPFGINWLWVIIGLGIFLFIFLFLRRKKKEKPKEENPPEQGEDE